jgi:putative methionine-R-sulfoxide reductase with GAF domain
MYIIGLSEEIALEKRLNQLAARYPSSHAYFLLYDGTFISLDPATHTLKAQKNLPPLLEQGFASAAETAEGEIKGTYISPITHEKAFTLASWVPAMNAAMGLEISTEIFFQRTQSVLPVVGRGFLLAALILTLVVWLTISYITRPLLQMADTARRFAEGDWLQRAPVKRNDEIGMLAHAFNQMADELSEFYRSLEAQVEERTEQLRAASEVAAVATSAADLSEILRRTVDLIVERFPQYYHASVFLIDENGYAVLEESTGEIGAQMKQQKHRLKVGSPSVVGWAAAHKQPRVASDVTDDPIHFKNPLLPETRSEAGIPLLIGNEVLGVLDVQSKNPKAFDEQSIATLQTLAGQLAAAIYNARLRERAEVGFGEIRLLYQISRRLAASRTIDDIMRVGKEALVQLPFISAMYVRDPRDGTYRLALTHHPERGELPASPTLNIRPETLQGHLPAGTPLLLKDLHSATPCPKPWQHWQNRWGAAPLLSFPSTTEKS